MGSGCMSVTGRVGSVSFCCTCVVGATGKEDMK